MEFDFTSVLDRAGQDAIAVDAVNVEGYLELAPTKEGFDKIPMWVADMNFATVPAVVEHMASRVNHPAYGYFAPREEYFSCIMDWQVKRNGAMHLEAEHIGYENGVLGGMVSALGVMCAPGEKILVHSPTYVGFTKSIENAGYTIVHSPLIRDEDNVWRMDFKGMEELLKTQKIHATVFCNPHNPCGRAWERWEVERVMALFEKYDVGVVADEIWSDILLDGHRFTPTQSVSEDARNRTVALYAPSKTFNLAGLVGSYHIIYNDRLRHQVRRQASISHYNQLNVLSMHALIGAYQPQGYRWVGELCQVLSQNVQYAYDFFTTQVSGVQVCKPEATYMLFVDCTQWLQDHGKTFDELLNLGYAYGVIWQDGRNFHGENCLRLNVALPLCRLEEAMGRLDQYVFNA